MTPTKRCEVALMFRDIPSAKIAVPLLAVILLASCCSGCRQSSVTDETSSAPASKSLERSAEKGPVRLTVRVTPEQPRLSDIVDMDLTIDSAEGVEITPPTFGKSVGDFQIRDYSSKPLETRAGRQIRRYHYQLEPVLAGPHLIHAVAVEFVDRRENSESKDEPNWVETEPLEIAVTSELGDAVPDLARLEAMRAPLDAPRPISDTVLGLVAAGLAGLLAFFAWRKRRTRRVVEPKKLTPEEIAQRALAALLAADLPAQGMMKEFFLQLTGIVRQYIEDTTGIRAPEQTTEEFLRDIRSQSIFSLDRSNRLAEFLEAADMIKYAGQQPRSGQIDDSISRAREFIVPSTEISTDFEEVETAR